MKNKNQYFSEVFSELLKKWCNDSKATQADFAKTVGIHENMVSRYKKGEAFPTDNTLDWMAQALGVNKEVFFPDKKLIVLEEVGKLVIDTETKKRIAKLERIAKLSSVFQELQKVYGVPDGWSERPLTDGYTFIAYLDEQIEHAFKMFFKYIDSPNIPEEKSENIENVMDGVPEITSDLLRCIKDAFPQYTTAGELFQLIGSENNREKALSIINNQLNDIVKKQP